MAAARIYFLVFRLRLPTKEPLYLDVQKLMLKEIRNTVPQYALLLRQ